MDVLTSLLWQGSLLWCKGLVPGLGTSACHRHGQGEKKLWSLFLRLQAHGLDLSFHHPRAALYSEIAASYWKYNLVSLKSSQAFSSKMCNVYQWGSDTLYQDRDKTVSFFLDCACDSSANAESLTFSPPGNFQDRILFFVCLPCLGPLPQHMEVPRLEV